MLGMNRKMLLWLIHGLGGDDPVVPGAAPSSDSSVLILEDALLGREEEVAMAIDQSFRARRGLIAYFLEIAKLCVPPSPKKIRDTRMEVRNMRIRQTHMTINSKTLQISPASRSI